MLIPELGKLRNRELSFGCVLEITEPYYNGHIILEVGDNVLYAGFENKYGTVIKIEKVADCPQWLIKYKIIGHPLTRGRICCIFSEKLGDVPSTADIMDQITDILEESPVLFDQNELQRMTSPKRPELRSLLIRFAEYF